MQTREIRSINKEREEQKAQLLQNNKLVSLGYLASGIAHEVDNPNNSIGMDASFLLECYPQIRGALTDVPEVYERIGAGIESINRNVLRIKKIVAELKNFYRSVSPGQKEPVDLAKVIEASQFLLAHELRRTAHFSFSAFREERIFIQGNFQRMEQVFVNLLINACQAVREKHGNQKGNIRVAMENGPDDGCITVNIEDDGIGMDKKLIEKIATPFYSTRGNSGGTGLGLYITAKIVEEHKGSIRFFSNPGEGTRVLLTFPVRKIQ
jgi:signal transduction histidine kinase